MLVQKFYQTHISKKPGKLGVDQFFGKPRTSTDQFMIYHFADKVTYDVWGFVEKNMDRLIPEHLTMLKSSSSVFVSDLFKSVQSASEGAKQKKGFLGRRLGGGGGPRGGKGAGRASVGAQVRNLYMPVCAVQLTICMQSLYVESCMCPVHRHPPYAVQAPVLCRVELWMSI